MSISIRDQNRRAFLDLQPKLSDCVLYVDGGAQEALAHSFSTEELHGLGIVHVLSLESATSIDAELTNLLSASPIHQLAILLTQPLTVSHAAVVRALQLHPSVPLVSLLCSLSEAAHVDLLGPRAYEEYTAVLQKDAQQARAAAADTATHSDAIHVTLSYFPLHAVPLDSSSFVLPAASAAASARLDGCVAGYSTAVQTSRHGDDDEDFESPRDASGPGVTLLAHTLVGLVSLCGYRCDIFALGPTAKAIGHEITTISVPPSSGSAPGSSDLATLLLVDRCYDVITPALHHDHVLAQVFEYLPRRMTSSGGQLSGTPGAAVSQGEGKEGGTVGDAKGPMQRETRAPWRCADVDVQVPCSYQEGAVNDSPGVCCISGSMFHPQDKQAQAWMEFLIRCRGRDGGMYIKKWMREALRHCGIPCKMRFKRDSVPVSELTALMSLMMSSRPSHMVSNAPLLQYCQAVANTLGDRHSSRYELLSREQRAVLQIAVDGGDALIDHMDHMIKLAQQPDSGVVLRDVLLEVMLSYCLLAEVQGGGQSFSAAQQAHIKSALVSALMSTEWSLDELSWLGALAQRLVSTIRDDVSGDGGYDRQALKLEVQDKVEELLVKFSELGAVRSPMSDHRRVYTSFDSTTSPLIMQLLGRVLDRAPLPDLQHSAGSIAGLLKAGLGKFGLQKQPAPSDHDTIFIFVVGGITVAELHHIRDEISKRPPIEGQPKPQVIVGGTALLNTRMLLDCVCNSNHTM